MTDQAFIEIHIESADGKHATGNTALTLPAGIQWVKNTGIIKVEGTSGKHVPVYVIWHIPISAVLFVVCKIAKK